MVVTAPTRRRDFVPVAVLLAGGLALVACGSDDAGTSAEAGDRTIEIEMRDIAFDPATLEVEAGETVTFVFENTGEVAHDAYLGDVEAQADHAAEMASDAGGMGDMHHGDDEEALTVEPGASGELTHTFAEDETLLIGCHQPGHYEAGMKVDITVS